MTTSTTSTTTASKPETKRVPCGDGCGELAAPKRSFLPGHDAKRLAMTQAVADGRMAQSELPALLRSELAAGTLRLPDAKMRVIRLRVTVSVPVAAEQGEEEATRRFLAALGGRKGWSAVVTPSVAKPVTGNGKAGKRGEGKRVTAMVPAAA